MRVLLLAGTLSLLSSCTPAVYPDLFNATGDDIVITKDKSKAVVTISPNASADFTTFYLPGALLAIRTPKHSWQYSFPQFRVPPSFYQQHLIAMRAFARIDRLGQIYLLAPPRDSGMAQETRQPVGFPVRPQKA